MAVARLHEYQGKQVLKSVGIPVPKGGPAATPEEAAKIASEIGGPVVVKMQAWTTHRASMGGIQFADTPAQASEAAAGLFGKKVGAFTVDRVLVEEKLDIKHEYYASMIIDDASKKAYPAVQQSRWNGYRRASPGRRRQCGHYAYRRHDWSA